MFIINFLFSSSTIHCPLSAEPFIYPDGFDNMVYQCQSEQTIEIPMAGFPLIIGYFPYNHGSSACILPTYMVHDTGFPAILPTAAGQFRMFLRFLPALCHCTADKWTDPHWNNADFHIHLHTAFNIRTILIYQIRHIDQCIVADQR